MEPVVGGDCGGEKAGVVWLQGGPGGGGGVEGGCEGRGVVVAGVVHVHLHGRGDVLRVRHGVLVRLQARIPRHPAAAQRRVPRCVNDVVEDTGAVREHALELRAVPLGAGAAVMEVVVLAHELESVKPGKHDPEHVIVSLVAEREGVLTEVVGRGVGEVAVYGVVVSGGGEGCEGSAEVGGHHRGRPIAGGGVGAEREGEELGLHRAEEIWEFSLGVYEVG